MVWRDGQQKDLETLGGYESTAFAVNNHGQVVGVATNAANNGHAFLWSQEGGLQDLGTLGASQSLANLINDRGQVSGVSGLCDTCNQDVFFWENGKMQRIPDFGGTISFPDEINNRGQVAGARHAVAKFPRFDLPLSGGSVSPPSHRALGQLRYIVDASDGANDN